MLENPTHPEDLRVAALADAQVKATELFDEVTRRGLIAPGASEKEVSWEIHRLGGELFGLTRHWHKRVVRSGPNTLRPYREDPPDRIITDDDIVFLDFGPVFADWEADFGRTYVLGDDPAKLRLQADLTVAFADGRQHFRDHLEITGAELFGFVAARAREMGWEYGGRHCGHLIGEFPHEKKIDNDRITSYICPDNHLPMRRQDRLGRPLHWILEIHFVDRERQIGGFHEELLTLGG